MADGVAFEVRKKTWQAPVKSAVPFPAGKISPQYDSAYLPCINSPKGFIRAPIAGSTLHSDRQVWQDRQDHSTSSGLHIDISSTIANPASFVASNLTPLSFMEVTTSESFTIRPYTALIS